jgi:hypothetical protein
MAKPLNAETAGSYLLHGHNRYVKFAFAAIVVSTV